MPELPEVETMRRGVLAACGATVVTARLARCSKRPLKMQPAWPTISRRLKGQTLINIDRRGKRLLLKFSKNLTLVIEPRMTGLLLIDDEPTAEHLRFELRFSGGDCDRLAYWDQRGLGQVFLLDQAGLDAYLSPARIGPDALAIHADELRDHLQHRSIPIKVGLLDQKAVAGVGNIYASEILHLAKIHPGLRCSMLTGPQWKRVHAKMLNVLNVAIQYEGSTLKDGTYRTALNDPGSYQNEHRVYDRAGESCMTCKQGLIRRIVQAQRSTYFCNACQKKR